MVHLIKVYFITNKGLTIFSNSFGKTDQVCDQDKDMIDLLEVNLQKFIKEIMIESNTSTIGFNGGTEGSKEIKNTQMIREQGDHINGIVFGIFDKDSVEREEYSLRSCLLKIIKEVEKSYSDELSEPNIQESDLIILDRFIHDKMALIYQKSYVHFNE